MVVVESAPPNLGELESRVLGVLWESRAPLSVREVGAALEVTA